MNIATVDEAKAYDFRKSADRVAYIKYRLNRMSDAKSVLQTKFQLSKQMYEVFEKHLTEGENWNQAYRFPETFGAIQRKYADLLEALPEVKIRGTKPKAKDFAVASQATYEQYEKQTNTEHEKARAIFDALIYGTGIVQEMYWKWNQKIIPVVDGEVLPLKSKNKKDACLYDGLVTRRVDPRDFYVDDAAYSLHDDAGNGAVDCAVRRLFTDVEWYEQFTSPTYKNLDKVSPVAWGVSMITTGKVPYEKESQEQKTSRRYYEVIEYWNRVKDMLTVLANGVEIYNGPNPYQHKKLPFVAYYNYRRDDSFWGLSEIEVLAPYIQAKEEIRNLQILDAKLKLQPALAVAGYAQFNEEENELQPGAVFNLRGVVNGKVSDAIMPLSFGGVDANASQVLDMIENDRIAATGDDTRALFANPGQLATQTLAKRESSQKRVRGNIFINTRDAEYHRAKIRMSNILQFIAKPYLSSSGRVQYRRIRVEGFDIRQDSDETKPYFTQKYGAQGYFSLNNAVFKNMEDSYEIEIVDVQTQESLKKQETEDTLKMLELMLQFPQSIQKASPLGLLKQLAKKINIDYYEVFPDIEQEQGADPVDVMIDILIWGDKPVYNGEIDPELVDQRLNEFTRSSIYKKLSPDRKKNIIIFQNDVRAFIPEYLQRKLAAMLAEQADDRLQAPGELPIGPTEGGVPEPAGGVVSTGGGQPGVQTAARPLVPGAENVQSRLGFR